METIQVADKPTLDAINALVTNMSAGSNSTYNNVNLSTDCGEIYTTNLDVSTLNYNFNTGTMVVYNNEIHVIGGYETNSTKHYKWNGSSWVSVSTPPVAFTMGTCVVYGGKIHIINGSTSNHSNMQRYHYAWDGTSWTDMGSNPPSCYNGYASSNYGVVWNNKIYILGSYINGYCTTIYSWDGSSWTKVTETPYTAPGCMVVYNNELHILASTYDNTYSYKKEHYKYDGSAWTKLTDIPVVMDMPSCVVFNNELHVLYGTDHYSWDGTRWTRLTNNSGYVSRQRNAVVYNNSIYMLCGYNVGSTTASFELYRYTYANRLRMYLFSGQQIRNHIGATMIAETNCSANSGRLVVTNNGIVRFSILHSDTDTTLSIY